MFQRILRVQTRRAFMVRNMGGGHHAPPKDGFEGAVRKYLKEDYHVVLGIMGFYSTLYLLSKVVFGGKKKEPEHHAAPVAVHSEGEMPSVDSPDFDAWLSTDGNVEKLLN